MKNLLSKVIWLLPLSAVLRLVDFLLVNNSYRPSQDLKLINYHGKQVSLVAIHLKGAILGISENIIFLAGITALVFYILEESKLKVVRFVLPFAFIETGMNCWRSFVRIYNFIFENNSEGLFISQPNGLPFGYISTIAGFCCFGLLFYSMYKSKLFPGWMVVLLASAYFIRIGIWLSFAVGLLRPFWFIQVVLFMIAYSFIAKQVSSSHLQPEAITDQTIL